MITVLVNGLSIGGGTNGDALLYSDRGELLKEYTVLIPSEEATDR